MAERARKYRDPEAQDDWVIDAGCVTRVHTLERKSLFVPINLSEGCECPVDPDEFISKRITVVRGAKGTTVVDHWKGENAAISPPKRKHLWTGVTMFFKTDDDFDRMSKRFGVSDPDSGE